MGLPPQNMENAYRQKGITMQQIWLLILWAPTSQNGQTHSNFLSVFDHFMVFALKGLIRNLTHTPMFKKNLFPITLEEDAYSKRSFVLGKRMWIKKIKL